MPRSPVVIAGVSMSHMPVSEITATSACSASRLASMNGSRLTLLISSSPSISTVAATGNPPALCQARNASSHIMVWPLSSTAPRATARLPCGPSTSTGSKGGLVQSSTGSAGCTS